MKALLKKIIYNHPLLTNLVTKTNVALSNLKSNTYVDMGGIGKIEKFIKGRDNKIIVGKQSILKNIYVRIIGSNNTIEFEEGCKIGPD